MDIKELAEDAVEKIKGSPALLEGFKADPKKTITDLLGNLDGDVLEGIIAFVKAKLGDAGGALGGIADKIGGLFGKKD